MSACTARPSLHERMKSPGPIQGGDRPKITIPVCLPAGGLWIGVQSELCRVEGPQVVPGPEAHRLAGRDPGGYAYHVAGSGGDGRQVR